jgi:hypothetical protein
LLSSSARIFLGGMEFLSLSLSLSLSLFAPKPPMASSLPRENYGKAGRASQAVRGDGGVSPVGMCRRLSRRRRGGVSPVGIPKLPQEKKTQRNARREEEE